MPEANLAEPTGNWTVSQYSGVALSSSRLERRHVMARGIYRLEPAADPSDGRWDLAPSQGIVVVRADSAADARLVASAAEADFPQVHAKPGDGVTTRFASSFNDEKKYHVVEDESGRYAADGERCVLEGLITDRVVKPLQE